MSEQEGQIVGATAENGSGVPETISDSSAGDEAAETTKLSASAEESAVNNEVDSPQAEALSDEAEPAFPLDNGVDDTEDSEEASVGSDTVTDDQASSAVDTTEADTDQPEEEVPETTKQPALASESETTQESSEAEGENKKKVVRILKVGQEISGTVKRLTNFGAFIDIGVGRDGLLHISELSLQRVSKVGDVLSQGQEVTVWIKELNREKNRISLTMISPDTKTIRDINKDDILDGTVTRMTPYGAFIDIGIGRDALLHVREMAEGYVKRPEDVVSIGEQLQVRVIEVSRRRGRVDLSIKGLRPEPEAEEPREEAVDDAEEELVDEFEDIEPMSAMELALKRAMEANAADRGGNSKRRRRKDKRSRRDDELDDIISRTLNNSNS